MFWAKLFLRHVCYFIVFFLIWQYLLCRFDGFCGISFSVCIVYLLFYVILPFVFSYFSLSLVDVLQLGIWREANSLVDPSLRKLIPNLLHLQLESRAPSALQKYRPGWLKWRQWAASKEYFHATKDISYMMRREEFRKYVKPFVDDIASYGTHSVKSGAASNPADLHCHAPDFLSVFAIEFFRVGFFLAPLARPSLVYIFSFSFCRRY